MTQMLRVNFILPGYTNDPIGGFRVVFEYADFLASRGHSVKVIFPMHISTPIENRILDQLKRPLWRLKTRIRNRPLIKWHKFHPRVRLSLVPSLRNKFISNADATVATGWTTAAPVAELSAAKGTKFYLIQGHETVFGPADMVNATWLLPLRKIVIAEWLVDVGRRLGADNLRHIPNGINFNLFNIQNPPDQRSMHIVSLYHEAAFKGSPDALAVLQMYHELFPKTPVSLFGVPERGREIPEWITYFKTPNQDVLARDIYNQGTIYLGASLSEGWALTPAEAMTCGCAFVGTDIGGYRDYAIHNKTALLSPPGDRQALLRNLVALTTDSALRHRIQKTGTEYIRRFTWERAGVALENYLLDQLVACNN